MISPQYTPFTGSEVRKALRIPPLIYADAVRSGRLQRSVHFDDRVSDATALHSLVDVVRFDLFFPSTKGNPGPGEFERVCENYLDDLCSLFGDDREVERLTTEGTSFDLIRYFDPIVGELAGRENTGVWADEATILFDVVESWCQCYRALTVILRADPSYCCPYLRGHLYSSQLR
jgi:hypothetical protein